MAWFIPARRRRANPAEADRPAPETQGEKSIERWEAEQRPPPERRFSNLLIRAWYIACFAVFGILLARSQFGPIGGLWIDVGIFIISAPLVWMLLVFVYGWIWFVLWLITWPIRPIRESRFMEFIRPKGD